MKSKVRLSLYSLILTVVITAGLLAGCIWCFQDLKSFLSLVILTLVLLAGALFCAPIWIKADDSGIVVKSVLSRKVLPMKNIAAVEPFRPTMGSLRVHSYRLFASGGYMGYWGLFRESDVGQYMAYYGKASDCFMIVMKNGDKYVLGCENPEMMIDYIKARKNGEHRPSKFV